MNPNSSCLQSLIEVTSLVWSTYSFGKKWLIRICVLVIIVGCYFSVSLEIQICYYYLSSTIAILTQSFIIYC